jgi:hypothetical protein
MSQINQLLKRNTNNKMTAFIMALILTVTTSFAFAADSKDIVRQVNANFKQHFKTARIISTDASGKYTKVTFMQNDIIKTAFYGDNGKLLAVVRNLLSSQLPADLRADLKDNYGDYWITELFQIKGEDHSTQDNLNCYYVSLESANSKVVLRSVDDITWEVFDEKAKN